MAISDTIQSPEVDSPSFGELQSAVANQQAAIVSNLLSTGGVLGVASGGTGSTSAAGARSALGAAPNSATFVTTSAETELSAESVLAGTANQITVTVGAGTVTISIPATLSITTAYQVNGTQVVSSRKTGWGSPSGTLSRAAYAAYAGQTVSNPPTQAQVQALDDAVKLLSQTVAALLTDMHGSTGGHGLLGA